MTLPLVQGLFLWFVARIGGQCNAGTETAFWVMTTDQKIKGFGFEHRESVATAATSTTWNAIMGKASIGWTLASSAIDIARLRLWLSLVVDRRPWQLKRYQFGLQNCSRKFIDRLPWWSNARNLQVEDELEKLKDKFYDITDEKAKKPYANR